VKIGIFQDFLLGALSGSNKYYQKELGSWKKRINENDIISELVNSRLEKNKTKRETAVSLSTQEKFNLWFDHVEKNELLVEQKFEKDGFKMGSFQDKLVGTLSGSSNKYYQKDLEAWREKIQENDIVSDLIDKRVAKRSK
jgi:hypothetical protein